MREAILAAHLAEFTRPVRHSRRDSLVGEIIEAAAIGIVEARSRKPAPPPLVIRRSVEPECALLHRQLLPLAPDQLATPDKRMVDRPAQWLPPNRCIRSVQLGQEVARSSACKHSVVVAAS